MLYVVINVLPSRMAPKYNDENALKDINKGTEIYLQTDSELMKNDSVMGIVLGEVWFRFYWASHLFLILLS